MEWSGVGDPAKARASHVNVDHRIGDIEALLVRERGAFIGHPTKGALDDPELRQHFEARFRGRSRERTPGRRRRPQACAIIGAVGEEMLEPGRAFAVAGGDPVAPA